MSYRFNCAVPRFRQPLHIVPIDPVGFELRDVVECSDNLEHAMWNRRRVVTGTVFGRLLTIITIINCEVTVGLVEGFQVIV